VNGDFTVLVRCISVFSVDTAKILRTSGHTSTSTAVPLQQRFGEGLFVLRHGGIFYKTANYNHPQFELGTNYEFCLARLVIFTIEVNHNRSTAME